MLEPVTYCNVPSRTDTRRRSLPHRGAALLFAAFWALAAASAASPDRDQRAIAAASRLIERWMADTGAPGTLIAVSRGGKMVWSRAFGFADIELKAAATPSSRFRIGSVSKSLTSAALGLLVEEGRIDLDAPIQRYVLDFPQKPWPITSRELAGHLAGIRHYQGSEFEIQRHYDTVRAGLSIFENDPLLFEPGTRFSYSSYGWNLLSAVIEAASGERFLEFMQRRVLEPAGMRDTAADDPFPIIPNRAHFYSLDPEGGPTRNALWVDNSYKWAGGGFLSTAEDLLRFANALMDAKLLKAETTRLLWTSQRTRDGRETGYGLGWDVGRDQKGRRRVGHAGGAEGGTAYLVLYPDERLAVAVLVNSNQSFTGRTPEIARLFLDGEDSLRRWESREAGFSLILPESWEARNSASVLTGPAAQAAYPKAAVAVTFWCLTTGRGHKAEPILTILAFRTDDWKTTAGDETIRSGKLLANHGGRVYVALLPQSNPYSPGSADGKAFEEMRVSPAEVQAAFRLLGDWRAP